MTRSRNIRRGFSLIELVIVVVIIAIIAAIAMPKMSRGAAGASDSAAMQNVSQMRSALDLYAAEHGGTYPTAGGVIDQLTKYTDISGTVSSTYTGNYVYGPYLRSIPTLPVGANKGLSNIVTTGPAGTNPGGWFYDTANNTIVINDPTTDKDAKNVAYNTY